RHRARHRRRLGVAARPALHDLPRPLREVRGDRADQQGRRRDEREVRPRREHPQVPPAAQGTRPRGRRTDSDPEAQAQRDAGHVLRPRGTDVLTVLRFDVSKPSHVVGAVAAVALAIFVVYELATSADVFTATLLKSLALGSVYAIIALAFVLIFKATEVINFAQGALAMIGALFISF